MANMYIYALLAFSRGVEMQAQRVDRGVENEIAQLTRCRRR